MDSLTANCETLKDYNTRQDADKGQLPARLDNKETKVTGMSVSARIDHATAGSSGPHNVPGNDKPSDEYSLAQPESKRTYASTVLHGQDPSGLYTLPTTTYAGATVSRVEHRTPKNQVSSIPFEDCPEF